MKHSQQSFFVFAIFLVGFVTAQGGPDTFEEIGTTSTGKTFLLTKENVTADWLAAHFYTYIYLSGNYSYTLAAIESHEETQLIDDYFRNGNHSSSEEIWIGGSSLGTAKPYENSYVKWTSSDVPISESSYSNFYPRVFLNPSNLLSWRVCVTGQYRSFNNGPTFFWSYEDCRLPLRYLVQRIPLP